MKTNIISIGNSHGVIIPSTLLRKLKLSSKSSVEVGIEDGNLVIKPDSRQGWAEAAMQMQASENDAPLLDESEMNSFDQEEWTW